MLAVLTPTCLFNWPEAILHTWPPSHGHWCDFILVRSGPFQKAGGSEVAFTQGYRNKPSEPVQNRLKIRMVRKSEPEIRPFANVPFHSHMNKKGKSSSGPLSRPAGFLRVHASAFHLLSPSILEKLSFSSEVPVYF